MLWSDAYIYSNRKKCCNPRCTEYVTFNLKNRDSTSLGCWAIVPSFFLTARTFRDIASILLHTRGCLVNAQRMPELPFSNSLASRDRMIVNTVTLEKGCDSFWLSWQSLMNFFISSVFPLIWSRTTISPMGCIWSSWGEFNFPYRSPQNAVLCTGSFKGVDNTPVFGFCCTALAQHQHFFPNILLPEGKQDFGSGHK